MELCREAGEVWGKGGGVAGEEERDTTWSSTAVLPALLRSKARK